MTLHIDLGLSIMYKELSKGGSRGFSPWDSSNLIG
jgi:hypothetical protein